MQDKLTRIRYENLSTIYLLQKISSHTLSRFYLLTLALAMLFRLVLLRLVSVK